MATPDLETSKTRIAEVEPRHGDEVARLRLLVQGSSALLGSLALEDVLPRILELAQRTLAADAYSLWRYDPATKRWWVATSQGLSEEYVASATEAIRASTTSVSLAEPVIAEDLETAEWLLPAHRMAHAKEGTRALLAVGLTQGDQVLGTIAFYYRRPYRFSAGEREAATTLANLAAAAIATAELLEEQHRRSEERRFIAEASEVLAASLDYHTTLANVARLAVPRFADWCAVDMVEENGIVSRLAVAHVDPEKVRWANKLADRYPPDPNAAYGVPNVIRTKEPELFTDIPDELLVEATQDSPELLEVLRELGLKSTMCVPLVSRDRVLGTITFVAAESGRHYDEADLAIALDLARRAAVAVDNALLLRRSEEARLAPPRLRRSGWRSSPR